MNRGELGSVEKTVYGFLIVAVSTALATACMYVANRDFQAGAIGFGGVFLVAGLASVFFAYFGCRLMLGASDTERPLSPGVLTTLAAIALVGVVGGLIMAAIHGPLLLIVPSGLVLIWICVSALRLAIARTEEDA